MTIYRLPQAVPISLPENPIALALGNFDGVHEGHRHLLYAAREAARAIPGCLAGAWTFTSLAKADTDTPALTSTEEKLRQFAEAGLDIAVLVDFADVRTSSPEQFVREHLLGTLHCAAAVCGFNFRFGYKGAGTSADLARLLTEAGVPLTVMDPVTHEGEVISSTRIRTAVAEGDMETAAALLGRPFSVCLPVRHGKQLGRTIGLPTINQDFPDGHIVPRHGIYVCLCTIGEECFPGVTNVGTRPSVDSDGRVNCETHLIDYAGDLYGENVCVHFLTRIRDEMRFDSLPELRLAIRSDIQFAKDYFSTHPFHERTSL